MSKLRMLKLLDRETGNGKFQITSDELRRWETHSW